MRWSLAVIAVASQLLSPFANVEARLIPHRSITAGVKSSQASNVVAAEFDQLIDHSNPSLGTFKQRYWFNSDFYGDPGSPIILESPGESTVNPKWIDPTESSITGLYASKVNGATVTLEHRYFGESQPFGSNSSTTALQHHTLNNAIQDLIYFANNVEFPFAPNNSSKPQNAPWVLVGCSYSGALAAWVNVLAPGTFWAYHCGSAVVETMSDFWLYFEPVKAALPKNCTTDYKRIVDHVNVVLANGTDTEKAALKTRFNSLNSTDAQFGEFMTGWFGNWQKQQLWDGYTKPFQTCDYIENRHPGSTFAQPGADGVGLKMALDGFERAVKSSWFPDDEFFSPADGRSWDWLLCNEPFGWWQAYAKEDTTGLIPKAFTTAESISESCASMFPDENGFSYGLKLGRTEDQVNQKTGGWNHVNTKRLMWINGEFDPWRPATVSSVYRPGGPLESTKDAPVYLIPGAAHCNDFYPANGNYNAVARKIFDDMVQNVVTWVNEFYFQ
ncbi:hypothetical protein VHEMI08511 [[Torrubiella] hemipterigena]|uniref:Serine peptidase n=1 Tax=[Torrubiella] hemipterigena TaxID=1531966 RepID=A0A0A1TDQ8_9HYPO|nr:hypothetical protein VHEMI08511 [[Torrubiella] hemipterigena]